MNSFISGVLKAISLLLFDTICLLIVFSVWVIVNIPLFPLALCSILFSLLTLNLVIVFSKSAVRLFGIGIFISALIVTVFYYGFIMTFTWATYILISPKWYLIAILTATLSYLLIITGLYIAGSKKGADCANQEVQSSKGKNNKTLLMNIRNELGRLQNIVEKQSYNSTLATLNEMEERLMASTPFGRNTEPVIDTLEQQIYFNLSSIIDELTLMKNANGSTIDFLEIKNQMVEVKNQIYNREKLIIK